MNTENHPPTTEKACEDISMDIIMEGQPPDVHQPQVPALLDQDPKESNPQDAETRKRRRYQAEKERALKLRWDLQCRIADISTDIELFTKEVFKIRSNLNHPLPPLSSLPDFEQQTLASANAKRLRDIVAIHCKKILSSIMSHKWSLPFNTPVDTAMYPDYLESVTTPMDLGTIRKRIESSHYAHPEEFLSDARLVFDNARAYNKPGSDVYVMANTLQEKFQDKYNSSVLPRIHDAELIASSTAEAARKRYATAAAGLGRQATDQQAHKLLRRMDRVGARIADAKSAAAAMCAPLSRSEKESLCESLKKMPNKFFEVAVALVLHHNPGLHPSDDVGFDLDQLDALTLRQLQSFVKVVDGVEKDKDILDDVVVGEGNGIRDKKEGREVQATWPGLLVGSGVVLGKRRRRHGGQKMGAEGKDEEKEKDGGTTGGDDHGKEKGPAGQTAVQVEATPGQRDAVPVPVQEKDVGLK